VRGRDFLPQVRRRKHWNWLRMQVGVQLFLMGMVKKGLADCMAQFADPVFANPAEFSTLATWVGVIAYAVQIYCDFSGYTDMAIGCAHLLGYRLSLNFNMPYLAVNVSEFWRRWHISLSSWLRDYLFIPLGGSRGSSWIVCRNLMLTMALGGLWHGTRWTFVVWGILHGLYLIVHRFFRAYSDKRPGLEAALQSPAGTVCRCALTFLSVCVGWVFFRATTFEGAAEVLARLAAPCSGQLSVLGVIAVCCAVLFIALCHAAAVQGWWQRCSWRLHPSAVGFGYALCMFLALTLVPTSGKAFIYFQF
jgi:alginate O-acetyltransferase complex protein AlgI